MASGRWWGSFGEVWVHETAQKSLHLVHHQERNMHGHMFGGVLLRLAPRTPQNSTTEEKASAFEGKNNE